MVLRFTDAAAMSLVVAAAGAASRMEIARRLQQSAAERAIPYLKLVGHDVVAGRWIWVAASAAAHLIADTALAVRDCCAGSPRRQQSNGGFSDWHRLRHGDRQYRGRRAGHLQPVGDAVTIAQSMAASALPGTVQATESAYRRLRHDFLFRQRGSFYLPQVGEARTFVLAGRL